MRRAGLLLLAAALAAANAPAVRAQDPPAEPTRFVAFGDSITAGVGDSEGREPPGYPPRLEERLRADGLADAVVLNRGVGAEKTFEGLARVDSVLRNAGGEVLLLMEGSNDISRSISMETTLSNLAEMSARAEAAGYEVIQATVIPRIPRALVDSENITNQAFNQAIRDQAGTAGRRLADMFQGFGSIDGDIFSQYYWDDPEDRVGHPNGPGYDVMTGIWFDVIQGNDTTPPVPGILVPDNGNRNVDPTQAVRVDVWDFGAGIDLANSSLLINGNVVTATPNGGQRSAQFLYPPPQPWVGVVRVGLRTRDLAAPANSFDREIASFIVAGTTFLDGDFDEDGRVDGADLVHFARLFGALDGQARYERDADFNDDGAIDGEDLAILASNFGQTSF